MMESLKNYLNFTKNSIKNAIIRLETMLVVVNYIKEEDENKKIAEKAVKENMPICLTYIDEKQEKLSLKPSNIFFPDTFLKKRDRIKKLYLELQNV